MSGLLVAKAWLTALISPLPSTYMFTLQFPLPVEKVYSASDLVSLNLQNLLELLLDEVVVLIHLDGTSRELFDN